jgi:hypothetical protein
MWVDGMYIKSEFYELVNVRRKNAFTLERMLLEVKRKNIVNFTVYTY